jgi:hypothetical protein
LWGDTVTSEGSAIWAIARSSWMPPQLQTSGFTMSAARSSKQRRNSARV